MSDTILGFNKSNVILGASLAGAAFIGYCIYYDHKRTTAPDYKQKLREKRRQQASSSGRGITGGRRPGNVEPTPEILGDPAAMQSFFLQEVQLGEELMSVGNIEEGAKHLANAAVMCGEPQQLLAILQQTMSPEQFSAIISEMPSTRERLANLFSRAADKAENEAPVIQYIGDGPPPAQIQQILDDDDDLE